MGRSSGAGRLVSVPGADDEGAGILHVDMDAFYAAVEVLDDPTLRGKALIIGSPESRSVISSASYEARRYGVRSAMPVGQGIRLCPHAITIPPRIDRYREVSQQVMAVLRTFTPLVEQLSIDEAFLDVRGARRLWGRPSVTAGLVRERVSDEVGITCSVGVAATKHVAKMASTLCKPDGLLVVPAARTQEFLDPRPVGAMWGVGPKTAEALEGRAIRTIGDLRETPIAVLTRIVGVASAERLASLARGEDARVVQTERVEKSISHEETFLTDVSDVEMIRAELLRLADRVAVRLRRADLEAGGVAIKVRFADFSTVTRSTTFTEPTSIGQRIGASARELFDLLDHTRPVRLIGVRAERLAPAGMAGSALWDDDGDWRKAENALDDAVAKFGHGALTRATHLSKARRHVLPQAPRHAEGAD